MSKLWSIRIRTYRKLRPGYVAVLTYLGPDGKSATVEEAIQKTAEVLRIETREQSKEDISHAVSELTDLLCRTGDYKNCSLESRFDIDHVFEILDEMVTDRDTKFEVGSKVLSHSVRSESHLNCWQEMEWAIKKLGESGRREAVDQLVQMCNIDNEGTDHYLRMQDISEAARSALEQVLDQPELRDDLQFQEKVWIRLLDTSMIYPAKLKRAAMMLGAIGTTGAIDPLQRIMDMDGPYRQQGITEAVQNALSRIRGSGQ